MDYKKLGMRLGAFSIGLGVLELVAPNRLPGWLGVPDDRASKLIRAFGVRELLAGGLLLRGPAVSTNAWNRVIGDGIDLAALVFAARRSSRKPAVAGAIAFVAGAAILDVVAARGLARQTGRTFPALEPAPTT